MGCYNIFRKLVLANGINRPDLKVLQDELTQGIKPFVHELKSLVPSPLPFDDLKSLLRICKHL